MYNSLSATLSQLRRRWMYAFLSSLVALGLIVGTPQPGSAIPWLDLILRGVQVIQLSNLSDSQEIALGRRINDQLTRQEFRIYSDRTVMQYVDQVGQRLVPASDRPNIPYIFQVVDDGKVNAFATMGGYVYVTTGLIKTADNEAQLASVLGHEMGHITARHAVNSMRDLALQQGIASAAGLDRNTAVNLGVELAVRLPNSRQHELEADQRGLATMTRASYAPSAMVAFMQKLLNQQPALLSILSSHPATGDRIAALNRQINPDTANTGAGLDNAAYRTQIRPLLSASRVEVPVTFADRSTGSGA
jgi:beta-barrel assembly-enhancing protease